MKFDLFGNSKLTPKERLERRRSNVRVWVTHLPAAYVFVGSAALIWLAFQVKSVDIELLDLKNIDEEKLAHMMQALAIAKEMASLSKQMFDQARDVFMLVLPVATGIITYWFASRKQTEEPESPEPEVDGGTQAQPEPGATVAAPAETSGPANQGQDSQDTVEGATVEQVQHGSNPQNDGR